jgi:hypothetical protein
VVTTSRLSHTHSLLSEKEIVGSARNRFIPEDVQEKAVEMHKAGETPAKIQFWLETNYKGICTWHIKDLYNFLYKYKLD